jgi:hypothetical protein
VGKLIKTVYDIFQMLFSTYFHMFSKIAYENSLWHISKQFNFIFCSRNNLCKLIPGVEAKIGIWMFSSPNGILSFVLGVIFLRFVHLQHNLIIEKIIFNANQ